MPQWGRSLFENRTWIIVHLRSDEMMSKHAFFGRKRFKNIKSWKDSVMKIPIHKGFGHIVYAAEKFSGVILL